MNSKQYFCIDKIRKMSFSKVVKYICSIILIALPISLSAQNNTNNMSQLASKYYQNGEYEKAMTLYEDLYKETKYKNNRDMYLYCLFGLKDYETAESFLKKEIKKNKTDFYLQIDLGMVYFYKGKTSEANETFEKAIGMAVSNETNTRNAANTFLSFRQYQYARKTYESASALGKDFDFEIAYIYSLEQDYEQAIKYYLNYLSSTTLSNVESRITYMMTQDTDNKVETIVERQTLERIQKQPNNTVLSSLLIWLYTQTGRNKQALNQLIAQNKRLNDNDLDIVIFGNSMTDAAEYEVANDAYNYIIKKKNRSMLYNQAYIGYLNTSYKKAVSKLNPSREELVELDSAFSKAMNEIDPVETYKILISSAQIKAFYLNDYDKAINMINQAITSNRYTRQQVSEMKLLLGDIYILNENPWDATLVYAQIEKSYADAETISEARLRKAKLAYYIGQFAWAQAQLDVLKAGTSKLISNDAIELSLFISENYDMDTTETTMQTFARADFYTFSRQYEKAFLCLDSIAEKYPKHSLMDDVLYRKAQIYETTNSLDLAAELYKTVFTDYGYDILADNALFKYAFICEKQKKNEEAKDAYFKLISEYSGSIFTVEARKRLRALSNGTNE